MLDRPCLSGVCCDSPTRPVPTQTPADIAYHRCTYEPLHRFLPCSLIPPKPACLPDLSEHTLSLWPPHAPRLASSRPPLSYPRRCISQPPRLASSIRMLYECTDLHLAPLSTSLAPLYPIVSAICYYLPQPSSLTVESLPTVTPYRLPFFCHKPFPTCTQLALILVLHTTPEPDLPLTTPVRLLAGVCQTLLN